VRTIYVPPWRVDVEARPGVPRLMSVAALARAIASALDAAGAPSPASIGLILSDDSELAALNRRHMDVDGPTDVLSFPMLEPSAFGRGRRKRWAPAERAPRTHIGDIAISVERAGEQAEHGRGGQTGDVRWSAADELRLLVTHGTLHLCGWDHAEPAEEAAMREMERELLATGR
jgi:probable rRNA maturation factor